MGMIFSIYIFLISFISFPHNPHKQTILAGSPAPSYFLYSLPSHISLAVFLFGVSPSFSFPFLTPSVVLVFRRAPVRWIACRSHRLSAFRLVGRCGLAGRFVPFAVSSHVGS